MAAVFTPWPAVRAWAAPYVTGIAALTAAADPTLQGEKLRQHLLTHALPLTSERPRGRWVGPVC